MNIEPSFQTKHASLWLCFLSSELDHSGSLLVLLGAYHLLTSQEEKQEDIVNMLQLYLKTSCHQCQFFLRGKSWGYFNRLWFQSHTT